MTMASSKIKYMLKYIILLLPILVMMPNQAKSNNAFVADHRYTNAAQASDYAQCSSLWAVYVTTKITTTLLLRAGCRQAFTSMLANPSTAPFAPGFLAGCLAAVPKLSEVAALSALYSAYQGYSEWAGEIRKKSKIVNTIDKGKPDCDSNLSNAQNSLPDGESTSVTRSWEESGPLANYCYKQEFDHMDESNEIYNFGESKIGISYNGNDPVWIAPEDCNTVDTESYIPLSIGEKRIYCAWTEGDEVCAEAVFCTGLGVGDIMPIYGFVGDPVRTQSEARRKCGNDPYSDNIIDDFKNGKRCECYCCDGSKTGYECGDLSNRSCVTYNERYNAHCIKKALPVVDPISPYMPPPTLSAHCNLDVNTGYKNFAFVGKAVRCFEKTMYNIYHGREDIFELNLEGEKILDIYGNPKFSNRCIDGLGSDDSGCTKAMYKQIQSNLENFITIILTFWAFFIGLKFLMGQMNSKGEFLLNIIKLGIILYFVQGNGWKDGYYEFLLNGSYHLSSDFFKAVTEHDVKFENIKADEVSFIDAGGDAPSCAFSSSSGATSSDWGSLESCNFYNGVNSYGNLYADGEKHYSIVDTIDCKFAKYIGLDRNGYFPHIISVALVLLFSHPSGIFFAIATMFFLSIIILILLKITFFLVVAIVMINFLIFISPIIIPLALLSRTKEIFNSWLKKLIGFSLQPFLILVILAFIIALLDGFYMTYLNDIYDLIDSIETREVVLGIRLPTSSKSFDVSVMTANMLKVLFLLVIVKELFEKFMFIIDDISGAKSVGSYIKSPDFEGYMKKARDKAAKAGGYTGKYTAAKTRQALTNARDLATRMTNKGNTKK